jgi:hypothetical protein
MQTPFRHAAERIFHLLKNQRSVRLNAAPLATATANFVNQPSFYDA